MAQARDAPGCEVDDEGTCVLRRLAAVSFCLLVLPTSVGAAGTDYGRIAYTSDRDGNYEIYSSRIDAPGDTNLTTNPANDQSAAWSADGSQIAFVSDRDGRMDIWVMDRDGSGQHKVTSGEAGSSDFEPTWSPDGERLAFTSSRGGSYRLWVVDLATGSLRQLTSGWGTSPAWSPDGARLAYDGGGSIRVVDATGSNDHQLTYCDCTGPEGSPICRATGASSSLAAMTTTGNPRTCASSISCARPAARESRSQPAPTSTATRRSHRMGRSWCSSARRAARGTRSST